MLPHCKRESQFELFQAVEVTISAAPRLSLPVQSLGEIDSIRLSNILGVSRFTISRMLSSGLFHGAYRHPGRQWRIPYASVVDYCNRLRIEYRISSRLATPPPGRRHRDEDLLPFPLSLTLGMNAVCDTLDCCPVSVVHLLEEGALVGYKLQKKETYSWRIDARSLEKYMERLRTRLVPVASSRKVASSIP
jgi:hypothetical protein